MARSDIIFAEPRRRNLIILAVLAVIAALLAALALWHQQSLLAPKYSPHNFFPGLAQRNRHIARIEIVSKKFGTVTVAFRPDRGWVLPGMHDYPADFGKVRQTIVGMAGLQTVAPKTARPDWLHYLNLRNPRIGRGVLITLYDDKGKRVAALIAGKTTSIGEAGTQGLFVRKPASTQSWLVRSVFTPDPDPSNWMKKDVLTIKPAEIQHVHVRPYNGPGYVVTRAKASDADFTLLNLPKGRELAYPGAADGPGTALVDFSFTTAVPVSDIDFGKAAELDARTFDGLTVTARVTAQDGKSWVTLSADAEGAGKAAQMEAQKINKATAGWAYEIPAYKAAQFVSPLDSLLKPAGKT